MSMLRVALAGGLLFWAALQGSASAEEKVVEVYKSPSCGCCGAWAEHLEANGYRVRVQDVDDLQVIKQMAGVPDDLQSCHTAMVGGYTVEGHVPASALDRLLEERPATKGLAVPGMPAGSPGMPSDQPERYQVFTFDDDGMAPYATFVGEDEE